MVEPARRAPAPKAEPQALEIAVRALAAVLGGYAATYGLTAALSVLLARAGLGRVDAAIVSTNLALLAYPAIGIWAFASRTSLAAAAAPLALAAGSGFLALALGT